MTRWLLAQLNTDQMRAAKHNALVSRSMAKELTYETIRTLAFNADRTLANTHSQRLLQKLADKFKLIDSFQRSLG